MQQKNDMEKNEWFLHKLVAIIINNCNSRGVLKTSTKPNQLYAI